MQPEVIFQQVASRRYLLSFILGHFKWMSWLTVPDSFAIPRAALLFMATVEEARRTNEGPFRAIAPIFKVALEDQRGQILNLETAARTLQQVLGHNFNVYAVEAFSAQLSDIGWLIPEKTANGTVFRVSAELGDAGGETLVETSGAKLDRLYDTFRVFLESSAPLFAFKLERDQFRWELFRWATSLDGSDKAHIIEHAKALEEGRSPSVKGAYLDETNRFSKIDRTTSIEFAGFVKWLEREGRDEISDIASLTELGLALEFIEELQKPSARLVEDIGTIFVLDAPVLLDLMGLSGTARKKSLDAYLSLLRKRGAKIVTLAHNLEEMTDIIRTILSRQASQRFGLTGDALRGNSELERQARGIVNFPDSAVKAMDVEVLQFDPASPLNAKYFDDKAVDDFRAGATWHTDLSKAEQRQRDALSIAFIMRRRQGRTHSDVLDTPYTLITRNSTFTRFSDLFCQRKLSSPGWAFGPAIEIKTLAAFLWMRFGSDVDQDLPQMQLIAACDRILASNGELMRKAEKKVQGLKGDDVTAALLNSKQAVLDLVIATGGNADVLDAADGEAVIRALTASAEARGRQLERQNADLEVARLQAELTAAGDATEAERSRALGLATAKVAHEASLKARDAELAQRDAEDLRRAEVTGKQLDERANAFSRRAVSTALLVAALISCVGQFFIWRGTDWWLTSMSNFGCGVTVVLSTFLLTVTGVEMIGVKALSLQARARTSLAGHRLEQLIMQIPDRDERARVKSALKALARNPG